MRSSNLSVRPITEQDIPLIIDYWLTATEAHLRSMGADPQKIPSREEWNAMLNAQLAAALPDKKAYAIIMLADNEPVGHCNINNISFGEEAHMHLHVWQSNRRKTGIGLGCVQMAIPLFFEAFNLKRLICEPYALNPAPNKTLGKLGFILTGQYRGIPGAVSFEQDVNRWELSREKFANLYPKEDSTL